VEEIDEWGRPEVGRPANIVIIISDDAGYADFSLTGSEHFPTPNIDRIAARGVRFTQGYVSASVCSPSRAGLMTGRYQQRFGHHQNIPAVYSETNGLPVEEVTLADALHARGYRTVGVGKWHLGYAPQFHPLARGFDDYYGFLQGSRPYRPLDEQEPAGSSRRSTRLNRLLRDREPVPETFEYITDAFGEEAAAYIGVHAQAPFFLYLSFSAVHTPLQAQPELLEKVSPDLAANRRVLAAMTISLDKAVGQVLDALERHGLTENTMVVFINDNGGPLLVGARNDPLRGNKTQPFEGGIRVPFVAAWPAQWPAGAVYEYPVSALDLFPTALAAAAGDVSQQTPPLDGVDLTPYLKGTVQGRPHQTLFWKRKNNFAVREGDWKLLQHNGGELELYNIASDPSETTNLTADHPEVVARLQAMYQEWQSTHPQPLWDSG
jgi:arylsulfatase A-like enzyme